MKTMMKAATLLLVGACIGALAAGGGDRQRLSEPRISPITKAEWGEEERALLEALDQEGRLLNVYRTLGRHPKLFERFRTFGGYILGESTLPPRERELLILRIGWLCRAEYEFGRHALLGKRNGLTDTDIGRIIEGRYADGLTAFDATLLRAVDELHSDAFLSDGTWLALSKRYNTHQLMDLVFTVGQYNMVSMALNTFGVQLEEGVAGFPE